MVIAGLTTHVFRGTGGVELQEIVSLGAHKRADPDHHLKAQRVQPRKHFLRVGDQFPVKLPCALTFLPAAVDDENSRLVAVLHHFLRVSQNVLLVLIFDQLHPGVELGMVIKLSRRMNAAFKGKMGLHGRQIGFPQGGAGGFQLHGLVAFDLHDPAVHLNSERTLAPEIPPLAGQKQRCALGAALPKQVHMILCVLVKGHPLRVLDGAAPPAFAGKHGDGEMIAHDGVPPKYFLEQKVCEKYNLKRQGRKYGRFLATVFSGDFDHRRFLPTSGYAIIQAAETRENEWTGRLKRVIGLRMFFRRFPTDF